MKTYIIDYVVGNTYKTKEVKAESVDKAIKKSRVKNIVDINIAVAVRSDFPGAFNFRGSWYVWEKDFIK